MKDTDSTMSNPIEVLDDKVAGYTLRRSVSSPFLLNIVAMNDKGEMLAVVESDVEFDKAMQRVDQLNNPVKGETP